MRTFLSIPSLGRSYKVNDFTLEESVGKHDMLTFWLPNPTELPDLKDVAAALEMDNGVESRLFPGYIDTPVAVTNAVGDMEGAFFMLGASSVMRSGHPRVWTGQRPFHIASTIVDHYGFGLEIEKIPESIPFFTQSADSDWQTLVRLGTENGLVTIGSSTVIRMVDPSLETRRTYRRIRHVFDVRNAFDFSSSSSATPIGFEKRTFIGVDKFGATFEVIANPESPVSLHAPELVASLGDALAAKDRLERRRHSRRTAQITVRGAPLARSGTCVTLRDGNNERIWFVLSAKHSKMGNTFTTSLTLCRDDDDFRGAVPLGGNQRWPQPINVKGKWRSSTSWSREL